MGLNFQLINVLYYLISRFYLLIYILLLVLSDLSLIKVMHMLILV
jgi:hypothetical protein